MPAGLILRDADDNVFLDTTKRLGRLFGTATTGTSNGSISPPGADQGDLFYVALSIASSNILFRVPTFTVSATTISWDWGSIASGDRASVTFAYGVR